jgi:hypothetical protein
VSATGALAFSVPIEVPAGRNGATPAVALSYSSASSYVPSAMDLYASRLMGTGMRRFNLPLGMLT